MVKSEQVTIIDIFNVKIAYVGDAVVVDDVIFLGVIDVIMVAIVI